MNPNEERRASRFGRVLKVCALSILIGASLAGCVVYPAGGYRVAYYHGGGYCAYHWCR